MASWLVMKNLSLVAIRVKPLLLIGLLVLASPAYAVNEELYQELLKGPFFWQEKDEVYQKMTQERFVPVSATHDKKGWSFKGSGIVKAPKDFVFDRAKDFNQLKELKEHFSNIAISSDGRNINLGVRFLGKERVIEIKTKVLESKGAKVLGFEVTGGLMKGLYGVLFVKDIERRKQSKSQVELATKVKLEAGIEPKSEASADLELSEVGLVTSLSEMSFWMPGFLFRIGAEGIMRHVAISLRDLVEKDYKNQRP